MKKISFEEFEKRANERFNHKYTYVKETYEKISSKIEIICPIHGSFTQCASSHLNGCECPYCYNDRRSITQQFKKEYVINLFRKVHGDYYLYDLFEYNGMNRKSTVICPIHGEFSITPNHHYYRKQGCSYCSGNANKTTEQCINDFKKVHGDKYIYTKVEYINAYSNVCIICPIHGEFWMTPHNHGHGKQGCPFCNESKLENKVEDFLKENNIEYEKQKKFSWLRYKLPMRLDFYLPKYNTVIECQGEQHFKKFRFEKDDEAIKTRQARDEQKRLLCEEKGIKVIYFSDKKYNENILTNLNEILDVIKND